MDLFTELQNKKEKLAIVGLGYVGLVLAAAFAEKLDVIGFDINSKKISSYLNGMDITNEIGNERLKKTSIHFTSDERELGKAKFYIIAVPTPINEDNTPDLRPVLSASQIVGKYLTPGSVIVYESTVFPGTTEELCIPLLEQASGLKCGIDFKVGYSPERVNPGDKVHTVDKVVKIVSGIDEETLEIIACVYGLVIKAGLYKTRNIKIAEAAKVIENAQRDINIAFINELALIFDKMEIDTHEVLSAALTKWNFIPFFPGLVGGHCIGVDPYYLTYKAQQLGYHSKVILAGRNVNNSIAPYVAQKTIKLLIKAGKQVKGANIAILGITFKENCPDIRNSKVKDIALELEEYEAHVFITDPLADQSEVYHEYNLKLVPYSALRQMDAVIIAVCHEAYRALSLESIKLLYTEKDNDSSNTPVLVDIKGMLNKQTAENMGFLYWRL